jgi:hypothetical protein
MGRKKNHKPVGIIRPLDPSDPRSLGHPCHEQQWLDLARALGRALARQEWDRLHGKAPSRLVLPIGLPGAPRNLPTELSDFPADRNLQPAAYEAPEKNPANGS